MRYLTPVLFAAAASVLSTAPAQADLGDQLFKFLADDGAYDDKFGRSVAISPDSIGTAVVGAPFDNNDNGADSGSAYLFDTTTGLQTFKLLPSDGALGDRFGFSVAISGVTAIVGARFDDGSGSAYLFDTTTGRQIAKLLPSDDGEWSDSFGYSVAISGATAIVGTPFDNNDNGHSAGSAYLFDTTTGRQIAKLLPNDGAEEDNFGISVAITSKTAVVGAWLDDANGDSSGSAYVFDIDTGLQTFKLLPNDGAASDEFGLSVASSGTTAIVGARRDDDNGNQSGSAYLFDTTTGRQMVKLLPNDGAAGDWFGQSVAISGGTAIVGALFDDDSGTESGSAYLFDKTTGRQIAKLLPNDGAWGDNFGQSVASSGETAIVGAYLDKDNGIDSGSAYLFDAATPGNCPWDLDDNAVVGASDLLALLASWGPCKDCPADFGGDGSVGASDLLALLANWGPCP